MIPLQAGRLFFSSDTVFVGNVHQQEQPFDHLLEADRPTAEELLQVSK